MGRRGPAPTPNAHLKARGSWRSDINQHEPEPESGAPDRPAGLTKDSLKIWGSVVAVVGRGVLTRDNGPSLARYCHGLARWWKLAAWLDQHDDTYTVTDQTGNTRHLRHPNVITYEKLSRDLVRLEQEFGLTPASRTRIHAEVSSKKKPEARSPGAAPVLRIAT